jgi:hypothetical protein
LAMAPRRLRRRPQSRRAGRHVEILLGLACNLMDCLAHLFTVRSCWPRGRQHWQLEGGPWGEHWSGEIGGGVR